MTTDKRLPLRPGYDPIRLPCEMDGGRSVVEVAARFTAAGCLELFIDDVVDHRTRGAVYIARHNVWQLFEHLAGALGVDVSDVRHPPAAPPFGGAR